MGSSIAVRDIDPGDRSWLRREARRVGVSMEELVRRPMRKKREKNERQPKPSEAFARHFGPEYGVELPPSERFGYRPVSLGGGGEAAIAGAGSLRYRAGQAETGSRP